MGEVVTGVTINFQGAAAPTLRICHNTSGQGNSGSTLKETSASQTAACVAPDLYLTQEPADDHGGLINGSLLHNHSRRKGTGNWQIEADFAQEHLQSRVLKNGKG